MSEGLRERKRRARQLVIEQTAIDLALEHGYDNVTVEMICEVAVISPRTFFNYAGSKERAVLGIDAPNLDDAARARYIAGMGGTPFEDLVRALGVAAIDQTGADRELMRKRRLVIQQNSQLATSDFARIEAAQASLIALVEERGAADGADPSRDRARMTVSLAFGILHFLLHEGAGLRPADIDAAIEAALRHARAVMAAEEQT